MSRSSDGSGRARATAALLVLAVLVVGIPLGLVAFSAGSTQLASWSDVTNSLTSPDDGRLFLTAVLALAWIAWALFTTAVVLEVVSIVRDLPTPQLPAMRSVQQGTAALVATASLLFASGHSVSPPAARPVAALVQTATVTPEAVILPPPAAADADHQTVLVKRHDTLWSLAKEHLGSGQRFGEIVQLNLGVTQPDGRALTASHWIYPGWVLRLPRVASAVPSSDNTYVVRPGDSLSRIARDELGDPSTATALFTVNEGREMPGGGSLHDPNLIRPGLVLALPEVAPEGEPPAPSTQPTVPAPVIAPAPPAVAEPAPALTAEPPRAPDKAPASDQLETDVLLGLGLATATGLVHELRKRRKQQQRMRPAGGRIPMPATEVARAERIAASKEAPVTIESAVKALRALASECRAQDRQLPEVQLVRLSPTTLILQLASEDDDAVSPFVALDFRTWKLDGPVTDVGEDDPYPALITLGVDGSEILLLNLESVGTLDVVDVQGDAARALLAELAVGPLCGSANLCFATDLFGVPSVLDPLRTRVVRSDDRLTEVRARLEANQSAFGDRPALTRHALADGLPVEIYVGALRDLLPDPWSGVASVAVEASSVRGHASLVVESPTRARLEPLQIAFEPQLLTDDGLAKIVELLHCATEPAEPPADADVRVAVARALPDVPATLLDLREDATTPPRLLVLGRVHVEHADDDAAPHRRRRATELVAYLTLHPGATGPEVDEALWPGKRVEKSTRNPFISRARQWLGKTPDGQPYLPLVIDGGLYCLRPEVSCDWHDFVRFAQLGLDTGPIGASALSAALDLVRGRPFLGVDPTTYTWAEADVQEMISAIVDVAHVLAQLRLEAGDFRGAQHAVARGLLADPCSELLYRDAMSAAIATGDLKELDRLSNRLRFEITALDPEETFEDETIDLLATRTQFMR